MTEPSLPGLEARPPVRAAGGGRDFRVGDRELPQVREAELRVRGPGSSRPRPAVPVDPVTGPPEEGRPVARGGGGGKGAPRDRAARGVHGDCRADRGSEREDLRGQADRRHGCALRDGRRERGLFAALAEEKAAEIGRLAAEAARSLGCEAGLEAAETVIRAGLLKLGGGMLEQLLAADPGHRGPRVPCGNGHQAEFVSCRDKTIDTVLGPVTLTRAWYHCAACKHGFAPRDAELGVAGTSVSPWLVAMNDQGRGRRPVREGRRAAEGPGRGHADRQARGTGGRGQRRRRCGGRPGPVRADRRPEGGADAAAAGTGHALRPIDGTACP